MADYYPLITRAVAGLDRNTGEARRALYERARTALVDQLRGITPVLGETDITRERLALEEGIRKVEAEMARRRDPLAASSSRNPQGRPPPQNADEADDAPSERSSDIFDEPESPPTPEPIAPPFVRMMPLPSDDAPSNPRPPAREPRRPDFLRPAAGELRRPVRPRPDDARPSSPSEGLKGFGDTIPDDNDPGGVAARNPRPARERYIPAPLPRPDFERLEPRAPGDGPRLPWRKRAADRDAARADLGPVVGATEDEDTAYRQPQARSLESPSMAEGRRYAATVARQAADEEEDKERPARRFLRGFTRLAIMLALIVVVGATAYLQRQNILAVVRNVVALVRGPSVAPPPPREATPQRPKIPDRIGQNDPQVAPTPAPAPQPQVDAPVAQRVVLYEEDPSDAAGKRYSGTAVWRTETVSPGPGQPADRQIRADITIPERNMKITWTLRRNADKDLPASHTVSINFTLPPDFSHGGIAEIRGVLMKQAEQTRGTSLAGLSVKVTTNFFLIGLSSSEADVQKNMQMLKERNWFDIAIVYNDSRRAILAVEKGTPGDRAFQDTFAAWGQ